jgi:hypothetical protein
MARIDKAVREVHLESNATTVTGAGVGRLELHGRLSARRQL